MSLKRHSFRNKLVEMLDDLSVIFKAKRKDQQGQPARFLTIKDVEILEYNTLDDKTEVLAEVDLQTDNGEWKQEIFIRQFSTVELFNKELEMYTKLETRCLRFDLIEPVKLISVDDKKFRVIYDFDEGMKLGEYQSKYENSSLLLGRVVAVLQGVDAYGLDQTNLRELCNFIIQQIPIQENDKDKIGMLLEPHFPIIDRSPGGYNPCTQFDCSFIRFKSQPNNETLVYVIPHDPIEFVTDRMTDVAAIYAELSFAEYSAYGQVEETKRQIGLFFKGYNELSNLVHGSPLEKFYPNGITLDLQMFINFFLLEMQKISSGIAFQDTITLQYMYFLLIQKPFLLL